MCAIYLYYTLFQAFLAQELYIVFWRGNSKNYGRLFSISAIWNSLSVLPPEPTVHLIKHQAWYSGCPCKRKCKKISLPVLLRQFHLLLLISSCVLAKEDQSSCAYSGKPWQIIWWINFSLLSVYDVGSILLFFMKTLSLLWNYLLNNSLLADLGHCVCLEHYAVVRHRLVLYKNVTNSSFLPSWLLTSSCFCNCPNCTFSGDTMQILRLNIVVC